MSSRFPSLIVVACAAVCLGATGAATAQIPRASRPAVTDTGTLAAIPGDAAAVRGTLPNGLRFIVRENHTPLHRAELRLVVNAGSVLEDDNQRGVAHLIEHMAFDGTSRFPKSAVVDYLESVGLRFGADLNAETTADQTVYRLTVSTDQAGVLSQGIAILAQWAHEVTFDSADVVAERGVVLAEWRLRTGGGTDPSARISERIDSLLYAGTRYPERAPIGSATGIAAATPASLKQFYSDWYRPDLMTVVVVGDVDREAVVQRIRAEFGALTNPSPERVRPGPGIPTWHGPLAGVLTDTAIGSTNVRLWFRQPVDSADSARAGDRHSLLRTMFLNIVSRRWLVSRSAMGRLLHPTAQRCVLNGGADFCLELTGAVPNGAVEQGLVELEREVAEIAQHGSTEDELDWARRQILGQILAQDLEDASKPSAQWAADYVAFTFTPVLYAAPSRNEEEARALLQTFRPSDLAEFVRTWCAVSNLAVIVTAPTNDPARLPDETRLAKLVDSVQNAITPPLTKPPAKTEVLDIRPVPGRIVHQRSYESVGATEWALSNGMRVVFKPTHFAGDELYLRAFAPGGSSLAPDSLLPAATIAGDAVSQALGWGDFTADALRRELFGDFLAGLPAVRISPNEARIDVEGSPRHAELLFQLLHIAFLPPRTDEDAFGVWRAQAARQLAQPWGPGAILNDALTSGDPHGRPPTPAELERVRAEQITQFYQARFGDASHFTVVIVGGLSLVQARPLVERYLASLPTRGEGPERAHPSQIRLQGVPSNVRITGGVRYNLPVVAEDEALTVLAFWGSLSPWTPTSEDELKAVLNALQQVLRRELRERRGSTYDVDVGLSYPSLGDSTTYLAVIQFASAPAQAAELAQVAEDLIRGIQQGRLPADVASDVAAMMRRATETAYNQNRPWLDRLTARLERGWPVGESPVLNVHVTPQGVADAARKYLDFERYVQLTLLPKDQHTATGSSPQ
jgi:zinc protease